MSNCHLECRNCAGCLHDATPELSERMTWEELERLGYLNHLLAWSSIREVQCRAAGDYELANSFNERTLYFERAIAPLTERALLEIALYGGIAL